MHVSIRSRRMSAGECRSTSATRAGSKCFNPLPPTVGGRIRAALQLPEVMWFQSAPADCRRENDSTLRRSIDAGQFQSAPAECRRENGRSRRRTATSPFQSAPADCRRENPGQRRTIVSAFQSAPADCRRENARTGSSSLEFQSAPADCRRENWAATSAGGSTVSIRSRRLSAGECRAVRMACTIEQFQSAPADCRRENVGTLSDRGRGACFNPLPPTVGGRIGRYRASTIRSATFQSAPADCRRENASAHR